MGGQGSSRWASHDAKTTVEECWLVDVRKLKDALSDLTDPTRGHLWAVKISTERLRKVRFEVDPSGAGDGGPLVALSYILGKGVRAREFKLPVDITSTEINFGGKRWWFACPLVTEDGSVCNRRVAKLWLPEGQRYFGCSECYDLTHRSSLDYYNLDHFVRRMVDGTAPEAREFVERELRAALSFPIKEARKKKERKKSPVELFDAHFGKDGRTRKHKPPKSL